MALGLHARDHTIQHWRGRSDWCQSRLGCGVREGKHHTLAAHGAGRAGHCLAIGYVHVVRRCSRSEGTDGNADWAIAYVYRDRILRIEAPIGGVDRKNGYVAGTRQRRRKARLVGRDDIQVGACRIDGRCQRKASQRVVGVLRVQLAVCTYRELHHARIALVDDVNVLAARRRHQRDWIATARRGRRVRQLGQRTGLVVHLVAIHTTLLCCCRRGSVRGCVDKRNGVVAAACCCSQPECR